MHTQNHNHIGVLETETEKAAESSLQPDIAESSSLSLRERAGVRGKKTSASPEAPENETDRVNRPLNPPFPLLSPVNPAPRGKVAQLPKTIRDQVNQMLDDGVTTRKIAKKLAELGHPGFFFQNIQRWKTGGYQLHLQEQYRRELDKLQLEAALDRLAADPNGATTLAEANELKLALQNSRLLDQIHDWPAETLLQGNNSKAYFQLSRSVIRQLGERTRRERSQFDTALKREQFDDQLKRSGRYPGQKIGASPETIYYMDRKYLGEEIAAEVYRRTTGRTIPPTSPESNPAAQAGRASSLPSRFSTPTTESNASKLDRPDETPKNSHSPESAAVPASPDSCLERDSGSPSLGGEGRGEGGLSALAPSASSSSSSDSTIQPFNDSTPQSNRHALTRSDTPQTNAPSEISNLKSEIIPTSAPVPPRAANLDAPLSVNLKSSQNPADACISGGKIVNPKSPPISPLCSLNPMSAKALATADQLSPIPPQPPDHIPVFDSFGAWISWIPRSGPGFGPKFEDALLFENSRGQPVCWINPKWLEQWDPLPDRRVALLDENGTIIQWIPQPDLIAPPPLKRIQPIRSRRFRYVTAWLQEAYRNERCGALVADY